MKVKLQPTTFHSYNDKNPTLHNKSGVLKCWQETITPPKISGSIIVSQLCEFGLNLSAVNGYLAISGAVNG